MFTKVPETISASITVVSNYSKFARAISIMNMSTLISGLFPINIAGAFFEMKQKTVLDVFCNPTH